MNSFQYIGNLTTPLSLVFIGIEMSKIPLGEIGFDKDLLLGVARTFSGLSSMCFGSDTVSACNDAVSTGFHYAGDHAGDDTDGYCS